MFGRADCPSLARVGFRGINMMMMMMMMTLEVDIDTNSCSSSKFKMLYSYENESEIIKGVELRQKYQFPIELTV